MNTAGLKQLHSASDEIRAIERLMSLDEGLTPAKLCRRIGKSQAWVRARMAPARTPARTAVPATPATRPIRPTRPTRPSPTTTRTGSRRRPDQTLRHTDGPARHLTR